MTELRSLMHFILNIIKEFWSIKIKNSLQSQFSLWVALIFFSLPLVLFTVLKGSKQSLNNIGGGGEPFKHLKVKWMVWCVKIAFRWLDTQLKTRFFLNYLWWIFLTIANCAQNRAIYMYKTESYSIKFASFLRRK